jgi:hypothetical protein
MSGLYPDGLPALVDQEAEELESIIDDLAYRSRHLREGSAEHRMIVRQLAGIPRGSQLGALIIEEYDMACKIYY